MGRTQQDRMTRSSQLSITTYMPSKPTKGPNSPFDTTIHCPHHLHNLLMGPTPQLPHNWTAGYTTVSTPSVLWWQQQQRQWEHDRCTAAPTPPVLWWQLQQQVWCEHNGCVNMPTLSALQWQWRGQCNKGQTVMTATQQRKCKHNRCMYHPCHDGNNEGTWWGQWVCNHTHIIYVSLHHLCNNGNNNDACLTIQCGDESIKWW